MVLHPLHSKTRLLTVSDIQATHVQVLRIHILSSIMCPCRALLTSRAAPAVSATRGRGSCLATSAKADRRVPHALADALRCAELEAATGVELWDSAPDCAL